MAFMVKTPSTHLKNVIPLQPLLHIFHVTVFFLQSTSISEKTQTKLKLSCIDPVTYKHIQFHISCLVYEKVKLLLLSVSFVN